MYLMSILSTLIEKLRYSSRKNLVSVYLRTARNTSLRVTEEHHFSPVYFTILKIIDLHVSKHWMLLETTVAATSNETFMLIFLIYIHHKISREEQIIFDLISEPCPRHSEANCRPVNTIWRLLNHGLIFCQCRNH